MNRTRYFLKNLGILTISNLASKILIFLLVPLYTFALSTEDVGVYDLVISTSQLLLPILTLNIIDAVMRFALDASKPHKDIVVIGIKYTVISLCFVSAFITIIGWLPAFSAIHGYQIHILLYFLFYVLNQFLIQFAKGLERVFDMGIAGLIGAVVMLCANMLFLLVFHWGLSGFFVANILGQALPVFFLSVRLQIWQFFKSPKINRTLQHEMLAYSIPLIATEVGWWVNTTSDRYVVSIMCGVAANGLLSVAYKIPQVISTLHGIFIQAWHISAIKEYGSEDTKEFFGNMFALINVFMSAACSWLILLAKPIAHLMFSKEFYNAWQYVPFLLISCVLNSAAGICGSVLMAKKDSKSMGMSAVYGATLNVVMNIALVYVMGVQGVAIATVIASFVIYWVRKKAVGDEIHIPHYHGVLITWVLLGLQAFIEIYMGYWRIELLLMVVMLVLNRKIITDLFSMVFRIIKR